MVGVAGAAAVVVAAVKADMVNTLVAIPQRAHQFEFGAYQVQAGGGQRLACAGFGPLPMGPARWEPSGMAVALRPRTANG